MFICFLFSCHSVVWVTECWCVVYRVWCLDMVGPMCIYPGFSFLEVMVDELEDWPYCLRWFSCFDEKCHSPDGGFLLFVYHHHLYLFSFQVFFPCMILFIAVWWRYCFWEFVLLALILLTSFNLLLIREWLPVEQMKTRSSLRGKKRKVLSNSLLVIIIN